jgi:hypothetical protein
MLVSINIIHPLPELKKGAPSIASIVISINKHLR